MSQREDLVKVAESLGLLDDSGELITLDSLMVMDFIVAIEEALGIQIPVEELQEDAFRSLDSVEELLGRLGQ